MVSEMSGNILDKTIGMAPLIEFWDNHYLKEYIPHGGSKIKFVTGRAGSGKTHFLRCMEQKAEEDGFKVVHFSAKDVWLYDFKDIYIEILEQCDIEECLKKCAGKIISAMGDDAALVPEGKKYADFLAAKGRLDPLVKREIRNLLRNEFLNNGRMDNNFALCASLLTGDILGHPLLEPGSRDILLSWLKADKTVKLSLVRAQGLSPSKITKLNARHMLRSLVDLLRMGGYEGLAVFIDDMEILLSKSGLNEIHYTRLRREDTYESIRQLIDEIDTLSNVMFVYSFDRELLDHDNAGIKSYQALWMRIQNEIVGSKINMFSDIMDLDKYADQFYSIDVCIAMSERMAQVYGGTVISYETAVNILEKSKLGALGTAELIRQYTVGEMVD